MPGHFSDQFDWLDEQKEKIGNAIGSGIQSADSFIDNNIPGGERWTQGVSNITQGIAGAANEFTEITDRAVTDPIQSPGDAGLFVVGSVRKGIEDFRYGARAASEAAGFDPRTGDALTLVAEEIATLGAGKLGKTISKLPPPSAPKLVPALAAVQQQTQAKYFGSVIPKGGQVLEAVTAKNPEILSLGGVKRGDDIISPEQAKHLTRRAKEVQQRVDKLPLMRDQLNEMIESGADKKKIKRFRDTIDDTKAMLHRKRSNVSVPTKEDPLWYQTTPGKAAKKQEEIARGLKAQEYLEAHHLFPKVLSSAFYDRMDWMINKGIAEQDDLVLMNNIAIKLGRKPGDYKSNMLNMRMNPHNELHTAMDYAKDEFNEAEWAKIVSKAKDVDDLLILWRDTIKNTVLPTAEDAISMNNLDKTIESVSPKFTGSKKPSKEIFKNLRDKQLSI